MATGAQVAREVVTCPHCQLRQFMTQSGDCRKCHQSLKEPVPEKLQRCSDLMDTKEGRLASQTRKFLLNQGVWLQSAVPISVWFFRMQADISQRELARRMGVPRTYVSKIENGKASPTLTSLDRLTQALGISSYRLIFFCEAIRDASLEAVKQSEKETSNVTTRGK